MTAQVSPKPILATLAGLNTSRQEADLLTAEGATITCTTSAMDKHSDISTLLYTSVKAFLKPTSGNDQPELINISQHPDEKHPVQEVRDLRAEIRRHDVLYYTDDNPLVSDRHYDLLMKRLSYLETTFPLLRDPSSPTERVGGQPSGSFDQVVHPTPMLSLANAFDENDFTAWHKRVADHLGDPNFPMHLELKIDGVAVRVVYRDGNLVMAATRGDGTTGEDVTHTVRTVRSLPLTLTDYRGDLEARGEVYLPRSTFHRLNQQKTEQDLEPYANPRNAAAGGIRQLNPKAASERGLAVWLYSAPDTLRHTQSAALDGLKTLSLPVNPVRARATSLQEVIDFYQQAVNDRNLWDYDADGVVIKVDNLQHHETLGTTGREPRWAIAWKFPPERVTTTLQRIDISHGRFGKLTPVAALEPVHVAGVTVRSASLHNEQDIHRKNIREGALVLLERAGDVIPRVTGPADPEQNDSLPVFRMPAHCPSCQTPVSQPDGDAAHWCLNESCPAKLPEQLQHFVGKSAMDIEGLGPHWCEAFIQHGMIANTADVYRLTKDQLLSLPRMGEKLAHRIVHNLETSKQQPFQRVLYSLGVFRLGKEVSAILSSMFTTVDDIRALSLHDLNTIEGIGPVIAESVLTGLRSPRVEETINTMRQHGVAALQPQQTVNHIQNTKEKQSMPTSTTPFTGKTVVVTGKLEQHSRTEAEAVIARMGGKPSGSITKSTDYLVVGEKPGSKLTKANQLGVPVVTDEEFREMLKS